METPYELNVFEVRFLAFEYVLDLANSQFDEIKTLDLAARIMRNALDLEVDSKFTTRRCFDEVVVQPALRELASSTHTIDETIAFDCLTIDEVRAAGPDQVKIIQHSKRIQK